MAIQTKTVEFAFPALASLTNNTLTNLTQISVFLPEGSKTFRSVTAHVTFDDIVTATGGSLTTKTLNLRLGAAAYTSVANANTFTNSGENHSFYLVQDYTAHFTTNWTGTSMTCDFQLQINQSTGTTLGMVNVCVTLEITYDYDDTSATQIKTVRIPLNAPVGALTTGAVTYDTIPVLDTFLPEASKVYRGMHLIVQGNEHRNAATTAHTMTLAVGATSITTGSYVGALASDRWFRYVMYLTGAYPNTAATQTFNASATVARVNHFQAYLVVTYEYNEASTTRVMQSLLLPLELDSPMGGTAATDYQRGTRELWVQEPGSITTNNVAFFCFWTNVGVISTLLMRVGTGSFVTYTDAAGVLGGGNGCMTRNDAAFTLTRGRNKLNFDIYRTDTTDLGWNVCGFWLVNYTSDKSSQGTGAHNKTVIRSLAANGTAAATYTGTTAAVVAVPITPTNFFVTALGTRQVVQSNSTVTPTGFTVLCERLVAEGGTSWDAAYIDIAHSDLEAGVFYTWSQMCDLFKRWPNDPDSNRVDFETARRWRWFLGNNAGAWTNLSVVLTYHTITYTVSGTLSGGFSNPTTLDLNRPGTGERLLTQTIAGDGSYSFTWYDNTEPVYVSASDGTKVGRSLPNLATGSP